MTPCVKYCTWLAAALLTGCSQLPLDGPAYRDITTGATATLAVERDAIAYDYALVDLNRSIIGTLGEVGPASLHKTFASIKGPAPALRLGVGDVIRVSIFESGAGGLFVASEGGLRQGNFVSLPNQAIGRSGVVSVPYAGSVSVAGRTPNEVERDIEAKLANRAIEPQVIVTLVEQNATTVSIVGDALISANKFKIVDNGERILDVISRASGLKYPGYEVFVTVQRKTRKATIHFPRLVADPKENIFVAPGDTIYVHRELQKFVAVGALGASGQTSGLTGQFPFDQDRLSLNEALAKAGGLQDSRANPAQVFVYRMEHRETLEKIGIPLNGFAPDQQIIPTIYRANFRDPSSFFFAQQFQMRNKDVIYAANSDSTEMVKFLAYARTITSTVSGVATDVTLTRDILSGRHILQ